MFIVAVSFCRNDVIIDTWKIFETDLIAIGNHSVIGVDSSISAAFLVPEGFLDKGKHRYVYYLL